ncbi:MAG: 3-methyl-2-oxobutanoate dehydrogenase subunit VorB [Planctomycetes bacterium]|nr:3-methyl-2-oxobutanoate dehydrogenase subunit VorB [Planctomycetota bacterium]
MVTKLAKGNSAVIIGALYAGCDCYFGYPITPASEILHDASKIFPKCGRKFVQAESEEAAINMVYGAASTGHRVLTASSGPGISLKQEGISYLAGAELPAVIVDVMRAGPGIGNIGPEQADYNQVVKGGGHGSYRCIVLAPNSVQEMCDCTGKAFELSQKYRTPVYVLADGVLGQMIEPLTYPEKAVAPTIDENWAVSGTAATKKNLVTSIFLDFNAQQKHNEDLQKKYAAIEAAEVSYDAYLTDDAEIVIAAYGVCSRIARTVVDLARKQGRKVGLFRPKTLFPFPKNELKALARTAQKFICVELSNGQFCDDVKLAIECSRPVSLVGKMGGNLVTQEEIMAAL